MIGVTTVPAAITTRELSLWYGSFQALREVTVSVRQGRSGGVRARPVFT